MTVAFAMLENFFAPPCPSNGGYFFAAARLAQISFILAESLALAAALILRFAFGADLTAGFAGAVTFLTLAQRALAAALILARAAALILNFFFGAGAAAAFGEEPKSFSNSVSRAWIFSLSAAALRSCDTDRLIIELIIFLD
jgi:hypothetical protein